MKGSVKDEGRKKRIRVCNWEGAGRGNPTNVLLVFASAIDGLTLHENIRLVGCWTRLMRLCRNDDLDDEMVSIQNQT